MTGVTVQESEGRGLGVFAMRSFGSGERIRNETDQKTLEGDVI